MREQDLPSVAVVTGPTACGKSEFAVEFAKRCNGEIVNADSVQLYRDFNIGACKPTASQCASLPHHLFSLISPAEDFDVGDYCRMADEVIEAMTARAVVPVITGGSGLYIRSLLCGLVSAGKPSEEVRGEIDRKEAELLGLGQHVPQGMHAWLAALDPATAARLRPSDLPRIRRALAVRLETGESLSSLHDKHQHQDRRYRAMVIALFPERESLYRSIDARVDLMMSSGLVEEVVWLRQHYPLSSRPFTAIGYRHVGYYLDGRLSYDDMVAMLKRDTRRFAKRQMTWWRNQSARLGWQSVEFSQGTTPGYPAESGIVDSVSVLFKRFLERDLGPVEKCEFVVKGDDSPQPPIRDINRLTGRIGPPQ